MIKQALKIFNSYRQIKGADNYVQGLTPLYEEIYKELPKSNFTIDIGTAYGVMALACKLRGDRTVVALDMTKKFTNLKMLADNNISFQEVNLEHGDRITNNPSPDLLIFTEILEHLNSNPLPIIKKLYDLTKPGGYVVCSTPAKELWGSPAAMNKQMGKKSPGLWNDLDSWRDIPEYTGKWKDEHCYHWDQFELVSLFTEAGFEVEDIKIIADFSHLIIAKKK